MAIYSHINTKSRIIRLLVFGLLLHSITSVTVTRQSKKHLVQSGKGILMAMQAIFSFDKIDEKTNVLTSMEATHAKQTNPEKYICYNKETRKATLVKELTETQGTSDSSEICFNEDLPKEVLVTGFWYELCNEI